MVIRPTYTHIHCSFTVCLQVFCEFIPFESNEQIIPPPTYPILVNFPILLLRPSVILAERVGLNFLKTAKYFLLKLSTGTKHSQGVIQTFLGDGGSTKKCDHNCGEALTKSSWNLYRGCIY